MITNEQTAWALDEIRKTGITMLYFYEDKPWESLLDSSESYTSAELRKIADKMDQVEMTVRIENKDAFKKS